MSLPQYVKTMIISVIIMVLDYLWQEEFTMALKVSRNLESIIWDIVPIELNNAQSLNSFKKSIRKRIPNNCPCRLCKRYVDVVGFL